MIHIKIFHKNGKKIILLNPAEKIHKSKMELRDGIHYTNDLRIKYDNDGKKMKLNKREIGVRQGQIMNYNENCKIYNKSKNKKYRGGKLEISNLSSKDIESMLGHDDNYYNDIMKKI